MPQIDARWKGRFDGPRCDLPAGVVDGCVEVGLASGQRKLSLSDSTAIGSTTVRLR